MIQRTMSERSLKFRTCLSVGTFSAMASESVCGRRGQVRSECLTCTFRASCCNACLSQAQVQAFVGSSVRNGEKGEGSKGGMKRYGGIIVMLSQSLTLIRKVTWIRRITLLRLQPLCVMPPCMKSLTALAK